MRTTENNHAPGCGRQEQLVAYLYDEAGGDERAAFEQHLRACAACRDELQAFRGVRRELGAWQVPFTPPIRVTTPRPVREALGELLAGLPGWFKISSGLATAAAAALVLFALAGTRLSVGQGGFSAEFGRAASRQEAQQTTSPTPAPANEPTNATPMLTRAEAEVLIAEAVARSEAQAKREAQAQLASLEARLNAARRAELIEATNKLREEHRARINTLVAERQRPTMNEWLFAANESQEPAGGENEKSN
jgi:hypothetical protein